MADIAVSFLAKLRKSDTSSSATAGVETAVAEEGVIWGRVNTMVSVQSVIFF